MSFDFAQISVPFRMQPGLRRLSAGEPQLTPLDPAGALFREKQQVQKARQSRWCVPGFSPAFAINSIVAHATLVRASGNFSSNLPLELAYQEDFAVLDAATGTVPWLCVCVPSQWAPEEKLGQSLASIHGPVADNAALQAAMQGLTQLVTSGGHWERFVWSVTPSGRYDQHPKRQPRPAWPETLDAEAFAGRCFLRSERQTFLPVGQGTQQAVFTIRVTLQPLVEAVQTTAQAQQLHDAIASMSPAVLQYKNLTGAKAALVQWLARRYA